jgi:hypothetical protein
MLSNARVTALLMARRLPIFSITILNDGSHLGVLNHFCRRAADDLIFLVPKLSTHIGLRPSYWEQRIQKPLSDLVESSASRYYCSRRRSQYQHAASSLMGQGCLNWLGSIRASP